MAKKQSEVNFFTYLNAIFYKRKIEYDKKICSAYLLSMWLAHDPEIINLVNKLNPLQFLLKDDIIYQYYFDKIPKGKRFIRWTKKVKEPKALAKKLEEIEIEFNVSRNEAKKILLMMERIK